VAKIVIIDLSVLLGNGDGTFQTARNFPVGSSPSSLAVGDFDGNGTLDLAAHLRLGPVHRLVLAGGVAVFTDITPPTVLVTAHYPGANAQTVRDTVGVPIEEQVSGVEGMIYVSSTSTNDGSYTLTVTFKLGMNSDMAQVLVQNRVSLALPVIPTLVQTEGINVQKMSPPDQRYNSLFLSNYATIYLKDELNRLPGVAGISYLGQRDYSLRAWLDPDKLAALGIDVSDVITAVSEQNLQVAATGRSSS
jgi:multidrug efflux pump